MPRGDEHDQDLVAAYVLGAVTPEEAALVEEHLLGCSSCRRLADELASAVAQLPALAGEMTPPPHLKARLLAAVSAEAQQEARGAPQAAGGPRPNGRHRAAPRRQPAQTGRATELFTALRWRAGPRAALITVAALLVVALVGAGLWRLGGGGVPSRHFQQSSGPPARAVVYRWVAMAQPGVRGELRYVAATRRLALDLRGLQALPAGRVYELWYIRGHYRLIKGVERFRPGADGRAHLSLVAEDPAHFTLVCLSVEGRAQARRPSMPLVAIASLG
jgi:hypothetical protein